MPLTEEEEKAKLYVNLFNFFQGHKVLTPICIGCYNKFADNIGTNHYIGKDKVDNLWNR